MGHAITAVLLAATPGCSMFLSDAGDGDVDAESDENITLTPENVDVMDTWLYEGRPDDAQGADVVLVCDGTLDEEGPLGRAVGLLRFDLAGVPAGAQVVSASLRLTIEDHGDAAQLVEVLASWDESTTWNSFGPEPGLISTVDFVPGSVGAIYTDGLEGQTIDVDVTESITTWLAGERDNRGWLFLCNESNGSAFYTSDAGATRWPSLVLELRRL